MICFPFHFGKKPIFFNMAYKGLLELSSIHSPNFPVLFVVSPIIQVTIYPSVPGWSWCSSVAQEFLLVFYLPYLSFITLVFILILKLSLICPIRNSFRLAFVLFFKSSQHSLSTSYCFFFFWLLPQFHLVLCDIHV